MTQLATHEPWRDLPAGKYLMPINADDEPYEELGWSLYFRTEPKTYRTGRTVGRHGFVHSVRLAPGHTYQEVKERADDPFDKENVEIDIELFAEDPNYWRAQYGKHEGNCGICGRPLTDPPSRHRGIGPDCAADLGIA